VQPAALQRQTGKRKGVIAKTLSNDFVRELLASWGIIVSNDRPEQLPIESQQLMIRGG
jgi:hypothetical protein